MKINFAALSLVLMFLTQANAQIVTEDVHFDFYQSLTNNDFTNHFSNGNGLVQIQTGGITGGCLATPDSISWGNDNAIYCSKYHPDSGDTTLTAVSFKYDSTTVNTASFQRAMAIFLTPYSDWNHYVIATVSGNKKLELLTYSWNNNPYPDLALIHNHWYRYELTVAFTGGPSNQVYIKAEVFDLGLSGTAAPSLVNSASGSINDNVLAADTAIQVSVMGTTFGGCSYLDDFRFHGREGFSNCVTVTAAPSHDVTNTIYVYHSLSENLLHIESGEWSNREIKISIFNLEGKKLLEFQSYESKTGIDISSLEDGVYIVNCEARNETKNFKIIVQR